MSVHITTTVEPLERRTHLSAAVLGHGVLKVRGQALAPNTITIANSADSASIDVTVNSFVRGQPDNFTRSFPKALGIQSIVVRGGLLADAVSIGQANATLGLEAFSLPARVFTGPGDDSVTTTSSADFVNAGLGNDLVDTNGGNDFILAGVGNDNVSAGGGDDLVRGMLGDDLLQGGDGVDRLNGGWGNDLIQAGPGNDIARGEQGDDTVEGGPDDDLLFGGIGNDILRGGNGNDTMWGGVGDDTLEGGAGDDSLGGIIGTNVLTGGAGADTFHVRDLALNPTNDYDATQGDVLDVVTRANREGPKPPKI